MCKSINSNKIRIIYVSIEPTRACIQAGIQYKLLAVTLYIKNGLNIAINII